MNLNYFVIAFSSILRKFNCQNVIISDESFFTLQILTLTCSTSRNILLSHLSFSCKMGNILSYKEQKALKPHLQGIEPASLAAIIWDSINFIGVDDDMEKLGIHFVSGTELEDQGQARVIFWDDVGVTDLPRKVFLEILLMIGEQLMKEYESNYDLERTTDLGTAVNKLQVALVSLQETLDVLSGEEGAKTYRERLDSGANTNNGSISNNLIEEIRSRRGSYMWTNGEPVSQSINTKHRQSKGIEGVFDRLPELRRRYDKIVGGSDKPLDRVRNKIKILTLFQKGIVAPTSILEEDDECAPYLPPSVHRMSTLSVQDDHMLNSSSVVHHSRSRSSSVCSYESVSSSKQLLCTDSPGSNTQGALVASLLNIQQSTFSQKQQGIASSIAV